MTKVELEGDRIRCGRFALTLERTLRVPADGKTYPLPPSFSSFPIVFAPESARKLPLWIQKDAFLAPVHQFEALWLRFEAADWKPNAVQIGSGGINVITGEPFPSPLRKRRPNYVVCPLQPWLDGFKTESGAVRQFVAAPLGSGVAVSEQLGGAPEAPALQLRVFEPKPGIFPDKPPKGHDRYGMMLESMPMGLGAGGAIAQQVFADPNKAGTWNEKDYSDISIYLLNSEQFSEITGRPAPDSPISAAEYSRAGLPWFDFYDETQRDLKPSAKMSGVKPLSLDDAPADPALVRRIHRRRTRPENK